jgi:hypothetical protein
VKHEFLFAEVNGMPGIVSPLKPDHDIRISGKEIDDLSFSLVSPLGTHNHDV